MKTPNTSATLAAMLLLAGNSLSANNPTDPVYIPDLNFKSALLSHSPAIDTDGNGIITFGEAQDFKEELNVAKKDINNLDGIEAFTKIKGLNCSENQIVSINISSNTELTNLNCGFNLLRSLDVSSNTNLTSLECHNNRLTGLDLTNNTLLTDLNCSSNRLSTLNIDNNTVLESLRCSSNNLSSLNTSENSALTTLHCASNSLSSLDLSSNSLLANLNCHANYITALDFSDNPSLANVDCSMNELSTIDFSNNPLIQNIDCSYNSIEGLNLETNRQLQNLDCSSNPLVTLDLSKNPNLKNLYCIDNSLVLLNVANGNNSQMEFFIATQNPDLTCIKIDENFNPSPSIWMKDGTANYSTTCSIVNYSSTEALPVEFTSFEAYLDEDIVELNWTTASEFENNFFAVERSTDGINYETIDEVSGAGTTTLAQYYTTEDTNPKIGVNYYRLKQVDFDGAFEYSDIVAVRYEGNDLVDVYPNPNYGETLYIKSAQHNDRLVDFQITNLQGQVIVAGQTAFSYGEAQIDLSSIPYSKVSTYFLTIMSEEQTPIIKKINIIRN